MPLIKWSEKFVIGITRIDNQHMEMIRIVNELHESMKTGKGQDKLFETMMFLLKYTADHFITEEAMMKHYGYPEYEAHRAEHLALIKDVKELLEQIEKGKSLLTLKIANFLAEWVKDHILANDLKLGAFLKNKAGNIT